MEGHPSGMNQGSTPPIPAPSGVPAPPPGPDSQQAFHQGAGAPVLQSGVAFTPTSEKTRRNTKRIVLAVVACVILGIVGVVGVTIANWTRTPEAKVREYLELLAAGKANAATAMVDPDLSNEDRVFLTDEVMASASSRLEIEEVEESESGRSKDRTVMATMRLDGERFTRLFRMSEGDSTLGVLKNWKIQDAMVSRVSVSGDHVPAVSVGGVTHDKNPNSSSGSVVMVYPGVYSFTAEGLGDYLQAAPVTVAVKAAETAEPGGTIASVDLKVTFTDKMEQAALEAAVAATNSCGSVPGNIEKVCPFPVQSTTLALLEVKKVPTSMKLSSSLSNTYVGEAVFRLQETSSWLDTKPYDLQRSVSATPKFDEKRKLMLDASGKPEFEISFNS